MPEPHYRVIAVDPGKLSGFAVYRTKSESLVRFGEYGFQDTCTKVISEISSSHLWGEIPVIVVEKFIMTGGAKSPAPWSLELIGALRYISLTEGVPFDDSQKPDDAKALITNDALKALGEHHPSPGGHQNDAVRHVFRWLVGNKKCTTSQLRCILELAGREQE